MRIFIKLLLSISIIILNVIMIIFGVIVQLIESLGGFIIFICIVTGIGFWIKKEYNALQLNIIAIVIVAIIQTVADLILSGLSKVQEMIYSYKLDLDN